MENESKYYVTQNGRGIEVYERKTNNLVNFYEVPDHFGNGWGWNVTPSGLDIELHVVLPLVRKSS